uniref:Protein kinase domain-containing protein n=1 Tax=Macrostomum lignano TaxID=282301 RepID=A0A1I8IM74_9PLAT
PGNCKRTAIHFAAMNETNSCLKWLISELGPACLLEKDSNGATPAHLAAQHHDLDSLRLIADSLGLAPFDFFDSGGKSVADYAERNSQHGARIREWIAEQRRHQRDGEERRLGQAMSGLQLRRAVDAQSEETPARPSLDPAFSSWDFLLDGDGNKQLLGAGGFGKVYKAFTDKRQTVAVKIVRLEGASSARLMDEAIEIENAEISVLKAIRHPNIVQFLKSERIKKGKLCIFTELISGHSLSELMQLQRRPFDEAAVRDFSKQICSALHFLHSRSPVTLHRDIKCSNIMLTNEGVIKLIDFGLAKEVFATMHSTKRDCGTTYFMAPELFSEDGRIVYSPKTDVWAFGCSVFEMLEMQPPNWQLEWYRIPLGIQRHDMPQLPAGTSALLRDFYGRCIQREPRRRAATAELLEHKFLQ